MERATLTTKSFIIALALVKKHIGPEEACLAAHVEVNSQIERWGEVEDSASINHAIKPLTYYFLQLMMSIIMILEDNLVVQRVLFQHFDVLP